MPNQFSKKKQIKSKDNNANDVPPRAVYNLDVTFNACNSCDQFDYCCCGGKGKCLLDKVP